MNLQAFILTLTICLADCTNRHFKIQKHPEYIPDETQIRKQCGPQATICDSMDNYPLDLVHKHLKENPKAIEGLLRKSEHTNVTILTKIGVSVGDAGRGETEMCTTRKEFVSAEAGLTKDDTWKYIFNNGEFQIEAVYCENPGGECALSLPGFILSCEQKYFYKTLTALNPSGTITTDEFKVPAGCVCRYKRQ